MRRVTMMKKNNLTTICPDCRVKFTHEFGFFPHQAGTDCRYCDGTLKKYEGEEYDEDD